MTDKVVLYLATRNLYDYLPAAYSSLLHYTKVDHVYLLIEDDTLPFKLPSNVTCMNVSNQTFFPKDGPNFSSAYTYMALMKAAVTKLFPDLHTVLILDVDTIVNDDITSIFSTDISDSYYAAVTEPYMSSKKGYTYSNVGVFLLNLDLLRSTHMDDRIISALNTTKYTYPEQDAFNELCGDRFTELPAHYNVTKGISNITGTTSTHASILHFASCKNWSPFRITQFWTLYNAPHPRVVAYIGNRKYYPMLVTAAKSLLSHSQVDHIYFFIEDDSFPEPLPPCISCVNVSNQSFFASDGPNISHYYSYMTAMRTALPFLLPDIDRVLLLDPDTIVVDDFSNIWNYDTSNFYFAAIQETRHNDHTLHPYYNAGVMLINLSKLRSDGMAERIIHDINHNKHKHLEQDTLNFLCHDSILDLPSAYNASFVSNPCRYPKIMHFLSQAKRFLPEASKPYESLPWDNIRFAKE